MVLAPAQKVDHIVVVGRRRDVGLPGMVHRERALDRASREHPVMIQAWALVTPNVLAFNSMALARLGIDERTPEPIGEVWIEKDARGAPTGILTGSVTNYYSSDSFNHSLWSQIPFVQLDKVFAAVTRGMRQYNAQGVTTRQPCSADFSCMASCRHERGKPDGVDPVDRVIRKRLPAFPSTG